VKILYYPASYLPTLGGLERVVHDLAQGLKQSKHDLLVLSQRYPRSLRENEAIEGIHVIRHKFSMPPIYYFRKKKYHLLLYALAIHPYGQQCLRKVINSFRPDIINIHFPTWQMFNLDIGYCRSMGIKIVTSLHGDDVEMWFKDGRHKPYNLEKITWGTRAWALRQALLVSDRVTACSRYLSEAVLALEPDIEHKLRVVENGVRLKCSSLTTVKRMPNMKYIYATGRLVRKKGFDRLIDAFAIFSRIEDSLMLVIAGEGPENSKLRMHIDKAGMVERVRLLGKMSYADNLAYMRNSEVLVIPSTNEAFGLVCIEGLILGKSIIASRVGGMKDVLNGSHAIMVEPTVGSIVGGLIEWLNKREELTVQAKKAARSYESRYSMNNMSSRYLSIYNECFG